MARSLRSLAASLCVPLALALTGCGFSAQTLQPYTPAEGVNTSLGQVMVRNVLVIADTTGQGLVSASLVSYGDDTLTAVAGTPHKVDGSAGSPLVVTATGLPLTLKPNKLVVLTDAPLRIAVSSPDLKAGLLADLTLTFSKAGQVKLVVPVLSSDEPEFEGITVGSAG